MQTRPLDSASEAAGRCGRRGLIGLCALGWIISLSGALPARAQTAETGALNGTVTDVSGKVVPGVAIKVTSTSTAETRTGVTQGNGSYLVPLLPPGRYNLEASRRDFKTAVLHNIQVNVTETATVNIQLQIGAITETVTVRSEPSELQITSAALGHVTDQRMVENLPLVTRNYTQILGLSPGVSGDVNNAADIGRGITSDAAATGGYSTAGAATNDNNFQMNGTEVNDLFGEDGISGGIPVPNPDSIQEFKVQTGQYDASYGRNAGANVNVVTKSGTNEFHGDVWEYFRNTVLNANDFFLNRSNQPRGVLDQNQFGFTFGGPVKRNKLFFFTSYQGTRQRNGLGSGCLASGSLPVGLTNDAGSRTAQALANEFNGEAAVFGGTVSSSNPGAISPVALAVLNAQLANGGFLIPAPQNSNGQTTLSSACTYRDDQFVTDVDFLHTEKSHFSGKFFWMNSNQVALFPGNQLGQTALSVGGFPQSIPNHFRDVALAHTYAFNAHLLNEAVLGFHRSAGQLAQGYPNVNFANSAGCAGSSTAFTLASICVPAPGFDNSFPDILVIAGPFSDVSNFNAGGNGQGVTIAQNVYDFRDSITYVRGRHSLRLGGGINRSQLNFVGFHFFGGLLYPSFPDFLLGNVLLSIDVPGVFDRAWRVWDGDLYVQDNFQVRPRLTLNLGFRYERQGALGEYLGRSSTFDPAMANPNPPPGGTLQGFIVASNFSAGAIPPGVTRASTNTAINNDGQNAWGPRVGFAWQLPHTNRLVLRGGYGIYYTRTTGEPFIQLLGAPPWGTIRQFLFPSVSTAFPPSPAFPIFTPYSPTTALTPTIFSRKFQPPVLQQYSMNLQVALAQNWLLEVGYQGGRGTKLLVGRAFNQALSASPQNPIRGQTSNTLANIPMRVPIEGFDPSSFATIIESAGASWYNGLNVSLSKRLSKGLQFLASYTWASALETNPGYTTGGFSGGNLFGDQNNHSASYGFDNFVRPQRLVISYVYDLPSPQNHFSLNGRFLGGWSVAGVTTFQSGHRLFLTDANTLNAFGATAPGEDRAQIAPGCTASSLVTPGSVTSRLTNYFNTACLSLPPVIGSDGLATGFGNSGIGILHGPDQRNFDISIIKKTPLRHSEARSLEFRAELFNAFNTPSFMDPSTNAGTVAPDPTTGLPSFSPSKGVITATSVNPRIVQFALKLFF